VDFIKNLVEQSRQLWLKSSGVQRASFAAISVAALLAVGAVGWWSSRPQYIPLASGLSPSEAADIVSNLDAAGIAHDMNFSGSTVLVPKQRYNEARVAAGDALVQSTPQGDAFSGSLLSDPVMNRHRVLQAKEEQLERSLMRMNAVASADVHIAQPDWTPFARERAAVTASVVLGIRNNAPFSQQQAMTVVAMVAGAVEGLTAENVTVTDLDGHTLSGNGLQADNGFARQLEYRTRVEADLASKAELLLVQMLGEGRAAVRVTADVDFTETERVETMYDADGEVKQKEKIENTTTSQPGNLSAGVAGVASNTSASATLTQQSDPVIHNIEKSDVEFAHAMTTDTTKLVGGKIKRVTIAAMVDLPQADAAATNGAPAIDKSQVESVIKQAVGFDETRGDQIEVLVTSLAGSVVNGPSLIETIDKWEFYTEMIRHASLGFAAVTALVLGTMLIRKLRPITLDTGRTDALDADRERMMAELSSQAQQNPEVVSRIIQAWLEVSDSESSAAAEKTLPASAARPPHAAAA
jgi:flagellar M-ring protein FliF